MINGHYYTTAEVARIFGVKRATVARWIRTGRINGVQTPGGDLRLPAKEIHAMTGLPRPEESTSEALTALVNDHFNADATAALLALAQLAQIDVAYLDRSYFADYLEEHHDHALTDDEWQRLAHELGEYCNVIDDLCRDAVTGYTDSILRAARIIPPEEET